LVIDPAQGASGPISAVLVEDHPVGYPTGLL
jgi:hypothetical protein